MKYFFADTIFFSILLLRAWGCAHELPNPSPLTCPALGYPPGPFFVLTVHFHLAASSHLCADLMMQKKQQILAFMTTLSCLQKRVSNT